MPQPDRLAIDQALSKTLRDAGAKPEKIAEMLLNIHDSLRADETLVYHKIGTIIRQGIVRLESTIGLIEGGRPLFPRRALSMVFGPDNSGKTWMMMAVAIQEMQRGEKVLWIDYEANDDVLPLSERFAMMGADLDMLDSLLLACTPKDGIRQTHHDQWFTDIREQKVSLVVIDSYGEMLARAGQDENRDSDVANINARNLKPLASQGAAVVIVDHTTKSSTGEWSAGSKRKRASINGAAYSLTVTTGEEEHGFTDYEAGHAVITCMKSRLGTYRRGEVVGIMEVEPGEYLKDGMNRMVVSTPISIRFVSPGMHDGHAVRQIMPEPVDVQDAIASILEDADQEVTVKYIQTILAAQHMTYSLDDVKWNLRQLAKASVAVRVQGDSWIAASLYVSR